VANLTAIKAGIKTLLEGIDGVLHVYSHQPGQAPTAPVIIFHTGPGRPLYPPDAPYGTDSDELTFVCYLLFKDTNFEASEADIDLFLPRIKTAVGHNMDADGSITDGEVRFTRWRPVYYRVGSIQYHALEFTLTVWESVTFTYAL
jgi:hypothetical protein